MGISKRHRRKRSAKCVKVKYNKKTCKKTNRKRTNRKKTNKKKQIGAGACQGKQCVPGRSTKAEKERRASEYRARRAEQDRMSAIIIAEMQRRRQEQELAKQRAEQERRAREARQRAEQQLARERAAAYDKISAELPTYRKMQQDFNDALNEERIKSEKKGEFAFEKFHQKKDAVVDLWERALSSQRELADKGVFMPFTKSLHEEMQKDPKTARQAGPLSRTSSPPLSRTSSPVLSRTGSLESCEEAGNCPIMG